MPHPQSQRRPRIRTVVLVVLTAGLLWYFFRNVHFADVWRDMRQADLGLIVATMASVFVTYVLRTWRWQLLLQPIGRARFGPSFRATIIGFTALFLLPGRVGEVLRAYLLAKEERLSFSATFATIIVERLLDIAAVLLLFGYFLLSPDALAMGADFEIVKSLGAVAAAGSVVGLVLLFVCAGHPERLGRWAAGFGRILPARLAAALAKVVQAFAEGLAVMRRPWPLMGALALSIPMWISIAVGIWLTTLAFDLTLSFLGSFLVVTFLVVGVALPTPGGVGGFEAMYQVALTKFFGATDDKAVAAALVLHAVSTFPIMIVGVIFMARAGLSFGRLREMSDQAPGDKPEA